MFDFGTFDHIGFDQVAEEAVAENALHVVEGADVAAFVGSVSGGVAEITGSLDATEGADSAAFTGLAAGAAAPVAGGGSKRRKKPKAKPQGLVYPLGLPPKVAPKPAPLVVAQAVSAKPEPAPQVIHDRLVAAQRAIIGSIRQVPELALVSIAPPGPTPEEILNEEADMNLRLLLLMAA